MSSPTTIRVHNSQALTTIPVSAQFYHRMYKACEFLIADKSAEDLEAAKIQIESGKVEEEWVAHYSTLINFLGEFDRCAQEQGNIDEMSHEEFNRRNMEFQQGNA